MRATEETYVSLFPPTKFAAPRLGTALVDRRVLTGRVEAAVAAHPMTLVSAMAGAGKTTLLAQWAEQTERMAAWVRLAPGDDDPQTLSAAVAEALRTAAGPSAAARLDHLLTSVDEPDVRRLVSALVNDLVDLAGVVLVLDDLHVLSGDDTLELLTTLVDHLPERAAMLAASRSDHPSLGLSLRTARGQVARLDFDDLRLSAADVGAMLSHAGQSRDHADAVARAAGGWAAAVRLWLARPAAAVGADETADGEAPHPFVADGMLAGGPLRRFVADEVVGRLDVDLREFLMRSSVLDTLSTEACVALTGRADASELLDTLARQQLLLSETATGDYRLHDLVRDHLRDRLQREWSADAVADLHLRAVPVTPPAEAVPHLVAAGRPFEAADRLAELALQRALAGGGAVPVAWLEMLPEEARRNDRLQVVTALRHVRAGRMDDAFTIATPLVDHFGRCGDRTAEIVARGIVAEAGVALGRFDVAGAHLRELDARDDLPPRTRVQVLCGSMWLAYYVTDWTAVSTHLRAAVEFVRRVRDRAAATMLALSLGPQLMSVDEGPAWLHRQVGWLRASGLIRDGALGAAELLMMGAAECLRTGAVDGAGSDVAAARRLSRSFGGLAWTDAALDRIELGVAVATGNHAAVDRIADDVHAKAGSAPIRHREAGAVAYAVAQSLAERGRRAEVDDAVARLLPDETAEPFHAVTTAVLRSRIEAHRGQTAEAESVLREAVDVQTAARAWLMTGHVELELASLLLRLGRTSEAVDVSAAVLRGLARDGSPGVLLLDRPAYLPVVEAAAAAGVERRFADRVLRLAGEHLRARSTELPGSGERITAREVEVLREVAAGRSNRDVAAALFISERTVKTHMTSLLRKLGASSRTHAVARARELGVLV